MELIKRWTLTHTTHKLFEMGQLMGFPWAPITSPKDAIECPHLRARGFFVPIDHPEFQICMNYPGLPYRCTSSMLPKWRRAPLIGEDNARIFQRELGLSKKEIQRLSSEGAI
jgi:crotonobetainyl-CoA:carnitine CoA-transferase CaiB-like acyl-CoA transferase